jgi:hypothetical protein
MGEGKKKERGRESGGSGGIGANDVVAKIFS